mgnify:CR=1 FL=1
MLDRITDDKYMNALHDEKLSDALAEAQDVIDDQVQELVQDLLDRADPALMVEAFAESTTNDQFAALGQAMINEDLAAVGKVFAESILDYYTHMAKERLGI